VYRVVHVEDERARSYALKLAQHAGDARFEREVELLSRIHHRGIPGLYGHGVWRHPMGDFPFLVMEWVPGVPLYEWAARRNPTVGQCARVLAELAWALEAVGGAAGAHRDVKGGNVLVVPGTGRVVLTDFGSGKFRGAATLTNQLLPPGTALYRSPEAWQFAQLFAHHPGTHYEPGMFDDLFSLGVLGYRLLTDEYPPPTDPGEKDSWVWYGGRGPRGPRELNPNVSEELDGIILRLLEVHPAERFKGRARLAAEALERATWGAGVDRRLFDWEEPGAEGLGGEAWERRPRLRSRRVVSRTEEQDETARVEHERQEEEARHAEGESVDPPPSLEETEEQEAPEPVRAPAAFG
jgi:serine/threonine protein kinase